MDSTEVELKGLRTGGVGDKRLVGGLFFRNTQASKQLQIKYHIYTVCFELS